jgi:hypothetical protein
MKTRRPPTQMFSFRMPLVVIDALDEFVEKERREANPTATRTAAIVTLLVRGLREAGIELQNTVTKKGK